MFVFKNIENSTFPSVVHANGMAKKEGTPHFGTWPVVLNGHQNQNFYKEKLNSEIVILTWKGGKLKNQETVLENSCKKHGVDLTILPWPENIPTFWEATMAKIYNTIKHIESGNVKTKYLMGFDASDVLFLKHPNLIFEDYIGYFGDKDSVWCAETNDWPNINLPKYRKDKTTDRLLPEVSKYDVENKKKHGSSTAFLNSGCFIGTTEGILEIYKKSLDIGRNTVIVDQALVRISQYLLRDRHEIDFNCKIFQCLYALGLEKFEIGDK